MQQAAAPHNSLLGLPVLASWGIILMGGCVLHKVDEHPLQIMWS
jgi:hypothetical protein